MSDPFVEDAWTRGNVRNLLRRMAYRRRGLPEPFTEEWYHQMKSFKVFFKEDGKIISDTSVAAVSLAEAIHIIRRMNMGFSEFTVTIEKNPE